MPQSDTESVQEVSIMPRPDSGFLSGILAGINQFKQTKQFYEQMESTNLQQEVTRAQLEQMQWQKQNRMTPEEQAEAVRAGKIGDYKAQTALDKEAEDATRDRRFEWYDLEGIPEGHSLDANAELVRNTDTYYRGRSGSAGEDPSMTSRRWGMFNENLMTEIDNAFFDYNAIKKADFDIASKADPETYHGMAPLTMSRNDLHWTTGTDLQELYEKQKGFITRSRIRAYIDADIAMFGTRDSPSKNNGWLTALSNVNPTAFEEIQGTVRGLIGNKRAKDIPKALDEYRIEYSGVEYEPYQVRK